MDFYFYGKCQCVVVREVWQVFGFGFIYIVVCFNNVYLFFILRCVLGVVNIFWQRLDLRIFFICVCFFLKFQLQFIFYEFWQFWVMFFFGYLFVFYFVIQGFRFCIFYVGLQIFGRYLRCIIECWIWGQYLERRMCMMFCEGWNLGFQGEKGRLDCILMFFEEVVFFLRWVWVWFSFI